MAGTQMSFVPSGLHAGPPEVRSAGLSMRVQAVVLLMSVYACGSDPGANRDAGAGAGEGAAGQSSGTASRETAGVGGAAGQAPTTVYNLGGAGAPAPHAGGGSGEVGTRSPPSAGAVATGPTGGAQSVCGDAGADCTDDPSACCAGALCVRDGRTATCRSRCSADNECNSGCCAKTSLGDLVCSLPQYCGLCAAPGAACGANSACCPGATCTLNAQGASYCADNCTKNSDCMSGCCAPLGNASIMVCSDVAYCTASR
jgi:hypothetical protein